MSESDPHWEQPETQHGQGSAANPAPWDPPVGHQPASAAPPAPQSPVAAQPPAAATPERAPWEPPPSSGPHVVQTDAGATDGLAKCPRCGSTDISLNPATGGLRCAFCRYEWQGEAALDAFDLNGDIGALRGLVVGSGTADIVPSTSEVVTFKCTACGAEVVIDTNHAMQARCHWCRNMLSMNQQIANGAVPDMVLPFRITKDAAIQKITEFVGKRKSFAHPRFRREFTPENVVGVYLPYMVVDVNAHAAFAGEGEHQTRSYTVRRGDRTERRYDADVYAVSRDFNIHINDLTVESSSERRDQGSHNTNNIINAIMPFDVENAVRYDSNYLSGYTSERRDTNLDQLSPIANTQAQDIARHQANQTIRFYDRGVRWDQERFQPIGQRWVSAYLPVWLYSYHQRKSNGTSFLHYVAVNGRTGETMGSVPLSQPKLLAVSAVVQAVGTVIGIALLLVGL